MNKHAQLTGQETVKRKFDDPDITATGEPRAQVALEGVKTLWFNTGTLCNIACDNCYIKSSPTNDQLIYITAQEVTDYLDQIPSRGWPTTEIGFTGGEPFLNPQMIDMTRAALERGYSVLILTNAMRPMMRKSVQRGLLQLNDAFPGQMTLRVSLDHFTRESHDKERGEGSFKIALRGMKWLRDAGLKIAVAGRRIWGGSEASTREGFAQLYHAYGFKISAQNPTETVLFPEMDETIDVPEITTSCWSILNKDPKDIMCATSRMVVKRKGAAKPTILACTLLAYSPEFELGETLEQAERTIKLNHPHCAKFCVLGGASCSA